MSLDKNNDIDIEKKMKAQEKIQCGICGIQYMKCNKSHHEKTKRHKNAELEEKVKKLEIADNVKKADMIEAMNDMKKKIEMFEKNF